MAEGKESSPSAGSVDAQTVATAVMVCDTVGYDTGKKRMHPLSPLGYGYLSLDR